MMVIGQSFGVDSGGSFAPWVSLLDRPAADLSFAEGVLAARRVWTLAPGRRGTVVKPPELCCALDAIRFVPFATLWEEKLSLGLFHDIVASDLHGCGHVLPSPEQSDATNT